MFRHVLIAILAVITFDITESIQQWQKRGCYKDRWNRALDGASIMNDPKMSNKKCIRFCYGKNFILAATQNSRECFCGNMYKDHKRAKQSTCNMRCSGKPGQFCGGHWRNSVFLTRRAKKPKYLGCYKDWSNRALNRAVIKNHRKMTNKKCTRHCRRNNYLYAATQYSTWCFCGNEYKRHKRARESTCRMRCSGDASQKCGGPWRNSVYFTGIRRRRPPSNVIQQWQKRGCYKDRWDRALDGASIMNDPKMSNKKCIRFCYRKKFILAATQNSRECFCGNMYKGHKRAKQSTCNMRCSGKPGQFCGGHWRNSVFLTGRAKKPKYLGCYKDWSNRALNRAVIKNHRKMTNKKCTRHCRRNNYLFAATQYSTWCFCGNEYKRHKRARESTCRMRCSGDASQKCGGPWRNSVYFAGIRRRRPPSNVIQQWQKRGCYKDRWDRALDGASIMNDPKMSNKKCIRFCYRKNFILAATQNSRECFCGNMYKGHKRAKQSTCNMRCSGKPGQFCGGHWRNSVFLTGRAKKPKYLGCYKDWSNRALNRAVIKNHRKMTNEKCTRHCRRNNYLFAATQYSTWCFCGNEYKHHKRARESTCRMRCSGDASQKCGGPWRNSVYFTGIRRRRPPSNVIQQWQKRGCYKDRWDRALDGASIMNDPKMSNKKCIRFCYRKNFILAATQNSRECFCGNMYKGHKRAKQSTCNMRCSGKPGQFCGGHWRNSVFLTGRAKKPKYLGCYKDWSNRALNRAVIKNHRKMTNKKCTRHCRRNNYLFAATQYSTWCFCGNEYKHHKRARESTCRMRCSGDASQKCGGPWRNSVYFTGIRRRRPPSNAFSYLVFRHRKTWRGAKRACQKLGARLVNIKTKRIQKYLNKLVKTRKFRRALKGQDFWIGLHNPTKRNSKKRYVWSDNSRLNTRFQNWDQTFTREPDHTFRDHCIRYRWSSKQWRTMTCNRKYPYVCERRRGIRPPPPPSNVVKYTYIGCHRDQPDRTMKGFELKGYAKMTTRYCVKLCKSKGFSYAATQYSNECFCSKTYNRRKFRRAPEGKCSMKCSGNPRQKCGGFWKMSVYRIEVTAFSYFVLRHRRTWRGAKRACEKRGARLVNIKTKKIQKYLNKLVNTKRFRRALQRQDFWIGLHNPTKKKSQKPPYVWSDHSRLNARFENWDRAVGEPNELGRDHCIRYRFSSKKWRTMTCNRKYPSVCERRRGIRPPPPSNVVKYTYIGCHRDQPDRTMKGFELKGYARMTTRYCVKKCKSKGFSYAATEYSNECFCSKTYNTHKFHRAPEGKCSMKCSGNPRQKCGGFWKMSVYKIEVTGISLGMKPIVKFVSKHGKASFLEVRFLPSKSQACTYSLIWYYGNNRVQRNLSKGKYFDRITIKQMTGFIFGQKIPGHLRVTEGTGPSRFNLKTKVPPSFWGAGCTVSIIAYFKPAKELRLLGKVVHQAVVAKRQIPCGVLITNQNWRRVQSIWIRAVEDNLRDGTKIRYLKFKAEVRCGNTVAAPVHLGTVKVTINDFKVKSNALCYSLNDPHMKTFDGQVYNNYMSGIFTLYRHTEMPYEVQAYYGKCNSRVNASCNCAIMIKAGDDVFKIDSCKPSEKYMGEKTAMIHPLKVDLYVVGKVTPGFQVRQLTSGKEYHIFFPNGAYVIVKVITYGFDKGITFLNVWVKASASDFRHTEGLCGSYDSNRGNDLLKRNGQKPKNHDDFSKSWSPSKEENLFEGYCPKPGENFNGDHKRKYCQCIEGEISSCGPNQEVFQFGGKQTSVQRNKQGVDIVPKLAKTALDPVGCEVGEERPEEPVIVNENDETKTPDCPTPSGKTRREAEKLCKRAINNSIAGKACKHDEKENLKADVTNCINDLCMTDDTDWSLSAVSNFKTECLIEELTNVEKWKLDDTGVMVPNPEVTDKICPGDCSNHGFCKGGECYCHKLFMDKDCSVPTDKPPIVKKIADEICDKKCKSCKTVVVSGFRFVDEKGGLKCHITERKKNGQRGKTYQNKATFINFQTVSCALERAVTCEISISHRNGLKSDARRYTVYDSSCETCSKKTGPSQRKDVCVIGGQCYRAGAHSADKRICSPLVSTTRWSSIAEAKNTLPSASIRFQDLTDKELDTPSAKFYVTGKPKTKNRNDESILQLKMGRDFLSTKGLSFLRDVEESPMGFSLEFSMKVDKLCDMVFISSGGELPKYSGMALYYKGQSLVATVDTKYKKWTVSTKLTKLDSFEKVIFSWSKSTGLKLLLNGKIVGEQNSCDGKNRFGPTKEISEKLFIGRAIEREEITCESTIEITELSIYEFTEEVKVFWHLETVDGGWSKWGKWSHCSKTCGRGVRTQKRYCNNPKPSRGAKYCQGKSTRWRKCNTRKCPVDGRWNNWSKWSRCSKTCGGGVKNRKRSCNKPSHGGKNCEGHHFETRGCNKKACPVDGRWNNWSKWSRCSKTCGGGVKNRKRSCNKPSHGGKNCEGHRLETRGCNKKPCPVNGRWNTWSNWNECSKTCEGGMQIRKRLCNKPPPSHGGKYCGGSDSNTRTCNQKACPVDGGWTEWSDWRQCSKTCGGGLQRRKRSCDNPRPSNGGKDCDGDDTERKECNKNHCPVTTRPTPPPPPPPPTTPEPIIKGTWGKWSQWTKCTKTCGSGTQVRERKCKFRGPCTLKRIPCSGRSAQARLCVNDEPCLECTKLTCISKNDEYSKECENFHSSRKQFFKVQLLENLGHCSTHADDNWGVEEIESEENSQNSQMKYCTRIWRDVGCAGKFRVCYKER